MPKSSFKQIEEDEKKVIKLLLEDSRQSPNEIAKKLGFSRQKAWKIIKKIEKNKAIWGYTCVIDESNFNRNIYFALSKVKAPIFERVDDIIKSVQEDTEAMMKIGLLGSYYINGVYDWILMFSAEDVRKAKKFCAHIQNQYMENLERIDLMECIFPLIKYGKLNPNIEGLKEFAII